MISLSLDGILHQVQLSQNKWARGIYLREPHEIDRLKRISVLIEPTFHEEAGMCMCAKMIR